MNLNQINAKWIQSSIHGYSYWNEEPHAYEWNNIRQHTTLVVSFESIDIILGAISWCVCAFHCDRKILRRSTWSVCSTIETKYPFLSHIYIKCARDANDWLCLECVDRNSHRQTNCQTETIESIDFRMLLFKIMNQMK